MYMSHIRIWRCYIISPLTFLNVNLLHIIHIYLNVCNQMTDIKFLLLLLAIQEII